MIKFSGIENSFSPGDPDEKTFFDLGGSDIGTLYSVEVEPVRWQEEKNQKLPVSCSKAKIKEIIFCS